MHIIQINASYKPAYIYGGPTMSVSKLSEELIKVGINTEVFTTTANGDSELNIKSGTKILVDGVPVTYFHRITKGNSHFSPALLLSLSKVLRKRAVSPGSKIVHIHAWWNLVSVGACLISQLCSRVVILSPRGTLSNYSFNNRTSLLKKLFHQTVGKQLLERCHFHVSSEKEKLDILNILEPKSITTIPNFVKLVPSSAELQLDTNNQSSNLYAEFLKENSTFKILFLSRVEEKKGLDILFNALHNIELNYHLTIAGTGNSQYIQYLKTLAVELGLINRITWIGQQSILEKFAILASHQLMVLPSHDESFANVVIESLSVGTPVLISSNVGLAEYVNRNKLGWICPLEVNAIASTLITCFADIKTRKNIAMCSPQIVRRDFSDVLLIKSYKKLYKTVL